MEGTNETPKKTNGQKSRNQNHQYRPRQFPDSPKQKTSIIKPTPSAIHNIASSELEQRPPESWRDSTGTGRLNQSNEVGVDNKDKSWNNNFNRRRGQNSIPKNVRRGGSRDGYSNRDRRYNSSHIVDGNGATENWNGKRHSMRGGFINNAGSNDNTRSSTTKSPPEKLITKPSQPNAWTDNAYPITKAFENPALKELLPGSTEEENEMLQRALILSLEEKEQSLYCYGSHSLERKCSTSSETEVVINEAEEAKKMLRPNQFPSMAVSMPDAVVLNPAAAAPPESAVLAGNFTKNTNESKNVSTSFTRKGVAYADGENQTEQNIPEVWDQFGARPKKKISLSIGRGFGRGRKGSEGKIGELLPSSVLTRSTLKNVTKPTCPLPSVDNEQFESNDLPAVIPKKSLSLGETQSKVGPYQNDLLFVDTSCDASTDSIPENLKPALVVANPLQDVPTTSHADEPAKILGSAEQPANEFGNVKQHRKALDNVPQQDQILDNMAQQVKVSEGETLQLLVYGSVTQQENIVSNSSEKMLDPTQICCEMPMGVDIAETQYNVTEEESRDVSISATAVVASDHSKDEEIRALKEELNRLKHGENGSHNEATHFPQPYGVLPMHVPYFLPMPYYRLPFPGMTIPVVQNDVGVFDSSFVPMPYMPNAQGLYPQEMLPGQHAVMPSIDNNGTPCVPASNSIADRPGLNSSLSPTAEEFHPRQELSEDVRKSGNFNNSEGRKPRPKQQNQRRVNTKNFYGHYQNVTPSFDNSLPNVPIRQFQNGRNFRNSHLYVSGMANNEYAGFNHSRVLDDRPPPY